MEDLNRRCGLAPRPTLPSNRMFARAILRRESAAAGLFAERWLTVGECADALCLSLPTVRKLVKMGKLLGSRFGNERGWLRIRASSVANFLEKGRNETEL